MTTPAGPYPGLPEDHPEAWGPRAHPERCDADFEEIEARAPDFRPAILRRLSLLVALMGVVALQLALLIGGGWLLLRWMRVACWLTGCSA